MSAAPPTAPVRVSTTDTAVDGLPEPWAVWLDNGLVRLGCVPALGGRLLSARVGDHELLWRDERLLDDDLVPRPGHRPGPTSGRLGDWVNHGGEKTWLAPQGWDGPEQWAGPPDPVLDSGPYDVTLTGDDDAARLVLTSGVDPRTGVQVSRTLTLRRGESGWDLHLVATNRSDRPVRWSLWNVTQLAGGVPGGHVDVGTTDDDGPTGLVPLAEGTGVPVVERAAERVLRVRDQRVVGKVGFPTSAGWWRRTTPTWSLEQRTTVDPAAEYPDGGSRVEVWCEHPLPRPLAALGDLDPPADVVECELLGPWTVMAPGASTSMTVRSEVAVA